GIGIRRIDVVQRDTGMCGQTLGPARVAKSSVRFHAFRMQVTGDRRSDCAIAADDQRAHAISPARAGLAATRRWTSAASSAWSWSTAYAARDRKRAISDAIS